MHVQNFKAVSPTPALLFERNKTQGENRMKTKGKSATENQAARTIKMPQPCTTQEFTKVKHEKSQENVASDNRKNGEL